MVSSIPAHGGDLAARVVFCIEIVLNLVAVAICFIAPRKFMLQFIPAAKQKQTALPSHEQQQPEVSVSDFNAPSITLVRWYGVLLTVLTYAEARALISYNNAAMVVVHEAALFGDLLHVWGAFGMARAAGGWTSANVFGVGAGLFLAAWRIFFLVIQYRDEHVDGRGSKWYSD